MKKFVEIWTDGACSGNPGAGGYGVKTVFIKYKNYNNCLHYL
jgi:ribonuclease HI